VSFEPGLSPAALASVSIVRTELEGTLGQARIANDLDLVQIANAQAHLFAVMQVAYVVGVETHQRRAHHIGGQSVGTGQGQVKWHRRAIGGTIAFHRLKGIDDGQVRGD
jgi:hypothetical protein